MTEPLSANGTGYPVINLICLPISMKTDNDANNSHIESYLFPRHFCHLWQPLLWSTVTTTGSLDIGQVHMCVGAA